MKLFLKLFRLLKARFMKGKRLIGSPLLTAHTWDLCPIVLDVSQAIDIKLVSAYPKFIFNTEETLFFSIYLLTV